MAVSINLNGTTTSYLMVIMTDSYAGNFERKLCAYATGAVGECEVGYREARDFTEEFGDDFTNNLREIIRDEPDDHGCHRPVTMMATIEGDPNHGMGLNYSNVAIFFDDIPTEEEFEIIVSRAREYAAQKGIKMYGYRFIRTKVKYSSETVKEEIDA